MTLLELLAVVVTLGVLALVVAFRVGPGTFGNVGARTDARRIALDLLQAQRRSIATGENHYLAFSGGSPATGYTLYRRSAASGNIAVDEPVVFPSGVVVTPSHTNAEFDFEGAALAAYRVTLVGPDQTWQVDAIPVTGKVEVTQTAP